MDLHELEAIAEREQAQRPRLRILCCAAAGCQASGALEIKRRLELVLSAAGKLAEVEVAPVGCMGLCGHGPLVRIEPEGTVFERVTPADAEEVVSALEQGPCEPSLLYPPAADCTAALRSD